jgi:3D-(3,5/4)-trihydroxycyclohexane-1,2-dione acylhydrolase (decyclizing)
VKFVNINVTAFDAAKHAATRVVADARETLVALGDALQDWSTDEAYQREAQELEPSGRRRWSSATTATTSLCPPRPKSSAP